jgi:hypothetical protein
MAAKLPQIENASGGERSNHTTVSIYVFVSVLAATKTKKLAR